MQLWPVEHFFLHKKVPVYYFNWWPQLPRIKVSLPRIQRFSFELWKYIDFQTLIAQSTAGRNIKFKLEEKKITFFKPRNKRASLTTMTLTKILAFFDHLPTLGWHCWQKNSSLN